jgi:hypothetical protein
MKFKTFLEDSGKQSKEEVNYRDAIEEERKHGVDCGNCTMYRSPGKCTAVKGHIFTYELCDLYERKHEKDLTKHHQ